MNLTNDHGLPDTIYRAMLNDSYSKGDAHYSCTELVDAPRVTLLKQRHGDEITEDASDRIWMLLGKLGHKLAEEAGADNALIEERLFVDIGGRRISGASDVAQWVYHDGIITDYKFTSVWTGIFKDRMSEWEAQQNVYAELFHQYGFEVTGLRICAVYRDWRPNEARRGGDSYPPRAEIIPLRLWPHSERQHYIRNRLQVLICCEDRPDDKLPECTAEERWEKPTTYAVMKPGRKTALRVLDTLEEADAWMKDKTKPDDEACVEKRPGMRVRCDGYCSVAPWCSQWKAYQETQQAKEAS